MLSKTENFSTLSACVVTTFPSLPQSSISSSFRMPSLRATLFTLDMTSSCTRLKLIASSAIPNSKYSEHNAMEISESFFTPCAGTKSPKPDKMERRKSEKNIPRQSQRLENIQDAKRLAFLLLCLGVRERFDVVFLGGDLLPRLAGKLKVVLVGVVGKLQFHDAYIPAGNDAVRKKDVLKVN